MSKLKRKILFIVSLCMMILASLGYNVPAYAANEYFEGPSYAFSENLENDEQTYSKYENYVTKSRRNLKTSISKENKIMNNNLPENTKALLNSDFSPLQLIQKEMNVETLEEKQINNVISSIFYDSNNDIYFYVEVNGNQKNLLFYINDYKYILEEENGNYYLLSENGNKLNFIETSIVNTDDSIQPTIQPRASWILIASNMKKTNKAWVTVLGYISTVTGGGGLIKGSHPILGVISFVTGAAALVGDQIFVTFYIKFSQSYRSDCTSYIKEVDDYYQYSNYTGFVKSNTVYFHAVRPDYAGQNCMSY